MQDPSYEFIISRSSKTDHYQLWNFDPGNEKLLSEIPLSKDARLDPDHQLAQVGKYLLQWGKVDLTDYYPCFPYRLFELDPTSDDPLNAPSHRQGAWPIGKFFHGRIDFGQAGGDKEKQFEGRDSVEFVPLANYMLNWIPTAGRGTYHLWNFDPGNSDPLPNTVSPLGSWGKIELGHELIPMRNFIIDWVPESGDYALWSFDPQGKNPVSQPEIQTGNWDSIRKGHQLVPIGNYILDWLPADRSFRLWEFDPTKENPLCGPLQSGFLPEDFNADTTLTGAQPEVPVAKENAATPGTMDFMRSKIKHVVYYMIENRSFDHVCGWLYENDHPAHVIGPEGPFNGASTDMFNMSAKGEKVNLSKYQDGKPSTPDGDWLLEVMPMDPYHENSDVLRQYFNGKEPGYAQGATPNMQGFVWNNDVDEVMETFTPAQLPVLNGLAKHFAISDEWFCSMPGGTDVNRAFSLTGSSLCKLNNFQNGAEYQYWPNVPHRPSIWKVLCSNGMDDWKIYNSIEWMDFRFTYHLFMDGQVPSVDQNQSRYLGTIDQFYADAKNGNLPAFSYVEPIWCANTGSTSYHPGGDLIPGEVALNKLFNALQSSGNWEDTLLIITFDEHGGIFDHVPPPYAAKPWPNDVGDGFHFDMMGVRVPTILVSPYIREKTVFRSETGVAYDSTSILATLLHWSGIPRSRWGLGERTHHAPTFESVLTLEKARQDDLVLTPPSDYKNPPGGPADDDLKLHDLHVVMVPRLIWHMLRGKMDDAEIQRLTDDIMARADNLGTLDRLLKELKKRVS